MPILSALLLAISPPLLPPHAATLIVYRAYAEPILFAPTLLIDGKEFGTLGQKRLLAFALPPGPHHLEIVWPHFALQRSTDLDIVAAPDGKSYVELQAAAGFMRRKGQSALVEQDPATGAAAIACCHPPR
ncbi:hypothetical protein M8312_10765 [Sphingomonas sp. KRR8]|uniref:hypothetical protein n=1 Tax=Sphingomonas sp. KRR8 TaxID=2942996 RepID=UPI002020FC6B|nr:hypothetical protein [Sphingomonas sp. KRR8]URD60262.1 hypothetical protein M8312_10765 [Sphingomonas sp. KRR8]